MFMILPKHKPFISDKTEDEDFYAATLLGIAKELE